MKNDSFIKFRFKAKEIDRPKSSRFITRKKMKQITKKIWSHNTKSISTKILVGQLRKSKPKHVKTYRMLVKKIAAISFQNPSFSIFYRGQKKEYFINSPFCSVYPSILRDYGNSRIKRRLFLDRRYEILHKSAAILLSEFKKMNWKGHSVLSKFPEVIWAILQHYEICNTPLLDVTASLRVACSFALQQGKESGVIYVFGMPNVNGSISYYSDEEIINLRLLSICPPVALRPHYQEGYLVGTFPTTKIQRRKVEYDASRRLLAKFKIFQEKFWDNDFQEIPREALFPKNDKMKEVAFNTYKKLEDWCYSMNFSKTLLPSSNLRLSQ
jgi:hypothetical protein